MPRSRTLASRLNRLLKMNLADLIRGSRVESEQSLQPRQEDIDRLMNEALREMVEASDRLTGLLPPGVEIRPGIRTEQRQAVIDEYNRRREERAQRVRLIIDEAGEIPQGVYSNEHMRYIPPEPSHEISVPGGFALIGSDQNISIGAHHRGIMLTRSNQGPGIQQWIRGYRDYYDLNKFKYLIERKENIPEKLEERRRLIDQHHKGDHD